MPFLVFDEIDKETVTPKYSTAYGELVTGEFIEVGRLSFKAGEGAVEHAHPHEQVMYVISGRLSVDLDGEHAELGPGMGFHARAQPEAQGPGGRGHPGHQLEARDRRGRPQDLSGAEASVPLGDARPDRARVPEVGRFSSWSRQGYRERSSTSR